MFSKEEKFLIQSCYNEKGWGAKRIVQEFPDKHWIWKNVDNLIQKLRRDGTTERRRGSGRPRTATTRANSDYVEEHSQSQENRPGTHKSQRRIAGELNISRRSVQRIQKSQHLKSFKRIRTSRKDHRVKEKRKTRCRRLLESISKRDVRKVIFTDEKDFTLEVSKNRQNDRVYGRQRKRNVSPARLWRETSRFSKC